MEGHVLFIKHPNKLFEARLFVNFAFVHLLYFFTGFRDGLRVSQLTQNRTVTERWFPE